MSDRMCGVRRPARGDRECSGPATFDVVVIQPSGRIASRTPCCFTHGLAETERAHRAGGIARTEMVPAGQGREQ